MSKVGTDSQSRTYPEAAQLWKAFDPDGKREVPRESFIKQLEKLDPELATNKQVLQSLLPALDTSQRGVIRFDDFVKKWEQYTEDVDYSEVKEEPESPEGTDDDDDKEDTLEELEDLFKEMDEDNKGYLTEKQFRTVFRDWTYSITPPDAFSEEETEKQITALWKEMGKDKDSRITWKELVTVLQPEETKVEGGREARSRKNSDWGGLLTLTSPKGKSFLVEPTSPTHAIGSFPAPLNLSRPSSAGGSVPSTPRSRKSEGGLTFNYEPSSLRVDPAIRKLRAGIRKLKGRNLTFLEMEAVNELGHVPSLKSIPLEVFAHIVDQVVEKKKLEPAPTHPSTLLTPEQKRRPSVEDPLIFKDQTRTLTEKNKSLQKTVDNLRKHTTIVDGENSKLLAQVQYLEDKLKTLEKTRDQQVKYLEESRKNYQEDAVELNKKLQQKIKELQEIQAKYHSLERNEREQTQRIRKLSEAKEKAEAQLGSKRYSPNMNKSQSFSGRSPATPDKDIKDDREELRKYIKSMEAEREAQLRLIGSLNASLQKKSPLKGVDESVSDQMQTDVEALRKQLAKLKEELKEIKETHVRDLDKKDSDLALKQAYIDQLKTEVQQLQRAGLAPEAPEPTPAEPVLPLKVAEQIKAKLEQLIEERDRTISKLEKEMEALKEQLEKSKKETSGLMDDLKHQVSVLEQKLAVATSANETLKKEKEMAQEEAKRAQEELQRKNEEVKITIESQTVTTHNGKTTTIHSDSRGNIQRRPGDIGDSYYHLGDVVGAQGADKRIEEVTPLLVQKKEEGCCSCCPCCSIL